MVGVAGRVAEGGRPWIFRPVVAALLLASAVAAPGHRDVPVRFVADHCGVERWAVKTGTDPSAGQVDLTAPKTTTVDALRSLTPPPHWGNSLPRIQPVEATVWVITAFFTAYAPEADSDYHLAVADEQGRTMIVEIPSPDCVGPQSPFLAGIQHARDQFEAARAELDPKLHQDNDFKVAEPPIPVQITGVGFFDKLHHQRGLAPNGIELHPVLDIRFNPALAPAASELITDGGFEAPATAPLWSPGTNLAPHPVLISDAPQDAHAGSGYARLGERNDAIDSVSQPVSIPQEATSSSLSFWSEIETHETADAGSDDVLQVQVRTSAGVVLDTVATLTNRDAAAGYAERGPFDLSAFAGQTVQLVFLATTDDALTTAFRIDDVSLSARVPGGGGTLPPATAVTTPSDGTTVASSVPVTAEASDPGGIGQLSVSIDGALRTTVSGPSLAFDWDTTGESNGPHTLVSTAVNAAGKSWTSAPVTITVSNRVPVQLLQDPGFELGTSSESPWQATDGVITRLSMRQPRSGSWYAWMDGYGEAHVDTLSQTVAIPASATRATLSFWLHVDTAESGGDVVDWMRVEIKSATGILLARMNTYSNRDAADGYVQNTFDLARFRGQTIQLSCTAKEDAQRETSFVLDDLRLDAEG